MKTSLIKWTGSKRHLASNIIKFFPLEIDTYYEPFLGGGSVFLELLKRHNKSIDVNSFLLSDKNSSLIEVFNLVKDSPDKLISEYKPHWNQFQKNTNYYYEVREQYNKIHCPHLFYFLTRTSYNGTVRYNAKGEFNTSCHFSRPGMNPDKVESLINYYHQLMYGKNILFTCSSFETICPKDKDDIIYLDPPYTSNKELYFGNIDFNLLIDWIRSLSSPWFMTINGVNAKGDTEEFIDLPDMNKVILSSGKSGFSKLKRNSVEVSEYFYYNKKN